MPGASVLATFLTFSAYQGFPGSLAWIVEAQQP